MNTSFALSSLQWRGVWGERTNSTPSRGYCANLGHPEDETGLVYMRARYYEPTMGRFISEDPARDGGNWYLYADGDPVGKVDADGNASIWQVIVMNGALEFGVLASGGALLLFMAAVDKSVGKYKRLTTASRLYSLARSAALVATVSFGLAALNATWDTADLYAGYILSALGGGLGAALFELFSWGATASQKMSHGLTMLAIGAAVIYGTLVIGHLASIGAEVW